MRTYRPVSRGIFIPRTFLSYNNTCPTPFCVLVPREGNHAVRSKFYNNSEITCMVFPGTSSMVFGTFWFEEVFKFQIFNQSPHKYQEIVETRLWLSETRELDLKSRTPTQILRSLFSSSHILLFYLFSSLVHKEKQFLATEEEWERYRQFKRVEILKDLCERKQLGGRIEKCKYSIHYLMYFFLA